MQIQILQLLRALAGLGAGALIGVSFGYVQEMAWRRHQRLQQSGSFNTGWAVMPGSMRRVAYLLVALALVQLVCPLFFTDGCQWWVSGGVAAGYGIMLYSNLRRRLSHTH